jgi:uncharacterized protein YcbK (DUF882 family)
MTRTVFVHQAIVSIPTTTLALLFSFVAHRTVLVVLLMFAAMTGAAQAAADDRALKLFFTHTGERATIVYKRNGKFDPKGLMQINRFLRDWRKNEPTRIDPRLLDLVWEVYRRSGANEPIHVVSAYRSPSTNNMLRNRSRSTGVAKKSQHMLGKAMDFYIPGVKLATLRGLAMQMQVGGVGYYPTSGSPFVHLDVGNVRAWPRMSRQELARLFPGGRTLHLPADGRPLPGYEVAVADQKKRVRPLAIQSARTDDDDDNAGSGANAPDEVTGSLVAALLPIPRSRAENGLARQLGRQADENNDDRPVPAIVSMRVPRPTLRPERSDGSVASTPSDVAPVVFASIVVGRSMAGELHVTDRAKNSITNRIATMQPVPSVPGAALRQLSAGVGAISTRALVAWALQPPGIAIDMTAPSLPGVHRPEEHAESENDDSVVELSEDRFNDERFGIEG